MPRWRRVESYLELLEVFFIRGDEEESLRTVHNVVPHAGAAEVHVEVCKAALDAHEAVVLYLLIQGESFRTHC